MILQPWTFRRKGVWSLRYIYAFIQHGVLIICFKHYNFILRHSNGPRDDWAVLGTARAVKGPLLLASTPSKRHVNLNRQLISPLFPLLIGIECSSCVANVSWKRKNQTFLKANVWSIPHKNFNLQPSSTIFSSACRGGKNLSKSGSANGQMWQV